MPKYSFSLRREFNNLLIISIGAVPGALIRWHLDNDFLVNIIGAGLFGFIIGIPLRSRIRLILCIGFCGALTTFSGWMFNSLKLFSAGLFLEGFQLIIVTLLLGLFSALTGFFTAKKIIRSKLFL